MCERVCMSKSVRQEVFRGLGFFWELVHLLLPTRFWSQPVPWAGLIISSERGEGWAYRKWERWEVWCCKQRDCEDWRGIGNDSMTSIQETVCLHVSVFVPFYVYAYWVRASGLRVCVRVCVWFCRFGACNMICEGNRKLLEWMRGKQCDMRQVGGRLLGEWGVEWWKGDMKSGGGCCQHAVAWG